MPGPPALCFVHRDVGALQQPRRVGRVLGEQCDADTGVDVQRDVGDLERALERRPQAQAGRARRGLVAGRQHDGELVAAEARQRVVGAQQLREPRPDLLQDLVAGVMAQRVVELLEAVEVDQQQRELAAVLARGTDRGMESLHEVPSIGEARQVVGERLLLGLAQPLGHGEPGTRHPGQHGDRRDGDRDVVDRLELPDRQQRERGRGEREDRDEHDGAELGARLGALGARPRRRGEGKRRQRCEISARAERHEADQRHDNGPAGPPAAERKAADRAGYRRRGGGVRAHAHRHRGRRGRAHRGVKPGQARDRGHPVEHQQGHARGRERTGRDPWPIARRPCELGHRGARERRGERQSPKAAGAAYRARPDAGDTADEKHYACRHLRKHLTILPERSA